MSYSIVSIQRREELNVKTSSHFNFKGVGRIVISRSNPRGVPGGYRTYRALAPAADMMNLPFEEYEVRFNDQLSKLDPQATWDKLIELAGEGNEPVLQCFECPPFDRVNFCHRRMVASWFERELGEQVPELGQDEPGFIG